MKIGICLNYFESQKINDWPILATCQSGNSVILSSEANGPVAHGSSR